MKIEMQKNSAILGFVIVLVLGILIVGTSATVSHKPSAIIPQGSGSGLDSDMVDGLHAADLLADSGTTDERKITLWGATSCPSGYNSILGGGKLTRFQAYSTYFGAVPPAVNIFVCAGISNATDTFGAVNGSLVGYASYGLVRQEPDIAEALSAGPGFSLDCVICERNTTA